jgi:SAM-dependent methyltransferase
MTTTGSVRIASTNEGQLDAWDGEEGSYWAAHADYFDRSVAVHHQRLMAAAAIEEHDHVLDVGCGSGQTTVDAARAASAGWALGVDLSRALLDVARTRASALAVTNASFLQADAQIHPFEPEEVDVVISRTAAMFFGDLDAAFVNLAAAVRPGGRLAMITWQPPTENEWFQEITGALAVGRELPTPPPGAPGPFTLADSERVREVLVPAGFTDVHSEAVTADMWFGHDGADAHRFILGLMGWMLDDLDVDGHEQASEALLATMRSHETSDGVLFRSGFWTTTARRP